MDALEILILGAIATIVIGLVGYAAYVAIDSWFLPQMFAPGQIVDKLHTPQRIENILIYNDTTKTSVPQPIIHPESWELEIAFAQARDSMGVDESYYRSVRVGDAVTASFVVGRLSGRKYLKSILMPNGATHSPRMESPK